MRVVLLAAGFATRLHPLTLDRAKPLLDVGGRPVLSWILDRVLEGAEPSRVVLVTNHRFVDDFRAWAAEAPVEVEVLDDGTSTNEDRLGAIGDLALAVEHMGPSDEPVLVVAGDNLVDFDLGPGLASFDAAAGPLVFVRRVPEPVPSARYSEVLVEGDRVTRFREKPEDPESPLSAICLHLYPSDLAEHLAAFRDESPDLDAPGHFLEWLSHRRTLYATPVSGPYHDIGNHQTLAAAREAFADRGPTT